MFELTSKPLFYKYRKDFDLNRPREFTVSEFVFEYSENQNSISNFNWALRCKTKAAAPFVVGTCSETIHRIQFDHDSGQNSYNDTDYLVTEIMPDESIIIQGYTDGEIAECSLEKTQLRFCHLNRMRLERMELYQYLGEEAYRKLSETLYDFPDHIVEFSWYSKAVGIHLDRLVIWEIRKNY